MAMVEPIPQNRQPLTETQLVQLREYFETQLKSISRLFIRRLALLPEILANIATLLNLLEYAINSTNTSEFGQTDYLLRISDDLVDYIVSLPPAKKETLSTLGHLDSLFSQLLLNHGLSQTELVRLTSIIDRTRIAVASKLGEGDDDADSEDDEDGNEPLGKIYEKTIMAGASSSI